MANTEHVTILKQGGQAVQAFRKQNPDVVLDLRNAELPELDLPSAPLSHANLNGVNLRNARLHHADLRRADLSGANLSGANLSGANLSGANLNGAKLSGANLSGADLTNADLGDTTLDGEELESVNQRRKEQDSADDTKFPADEGNENTTIKNQGEQIIQKGDLSFPVISDADHHWENTLKPDEGNRISRKVIGVNLRKAKLTGAIMNRADLRYADMFEADLSGAKINGTNLSHAKLNGATLTGAIMVGAILSHTQLDGADLTGADVSRASVDSNTSFRNLKSILRLKVDRSTVEYMFPDAATRGPKMMDMEVIDDLATLRGAFGGPVGFIYWLGLIAFLIPPLWFVCSQAVAAQTKRELASFVRQNPGLGHWVPAAGSRNPAISKPPQTIMLGTALLRFLWNGGIDWRNGWSLHYTFFLFCTGFLYRFASLILLFDAMRRINEQTIRGTPAKFSFSMPFEVRVLWIPGWTIVLSTYGRWNDANRCLSIVAAIIAIVNLVHHMQMVIVVE